MRRKSLVGASADSTGKEQRHTPVPQAWTTPRIRHPLQQIKPGGSKSTTPHTVRALQQRRATPGQDRRKSGRTQRETPRDALRNLSKILAGSSQPLRPSSRSYLAPSKLSEDQSQLEFEDELSPEQPQFTINVEESRIAEYGNGGDDDSSLLIHPTFSVPLEEGEQTVKSVEQARRASLSDERGFGKRQSGSPSVAENMDRSMELKFENSLQGMRNNRQWQNNQDDVSFLPGYNSLG